MVREITRKTFKIRPSGRSSDYISPSFGYGCLLDCSYCYMKTSWSMTVVRPRLEVNGRSKSNV